ncbi:hypothetical protein NL676_016450 [Syzygium grande]|nr:hypothetical protein NL676_016450 [Syzygium grande]
MALASTEKVILRSIAFSIFWVLAVFPFVPFLPVGRTAGSLLGAMLMVIFQVITPDQADAAIDLPIFGLLFGTMVVSVYLEKADMFKHLARQHNLPPHPFLLALASSANIGSSATPIGNPQNLVIVVRKDAASEGVDEEDMGSHRFSPATMSHCTSPNLQEWNSRSRAVLLPQRGTQLLQKRRFMMVLLRKSMKRCCLGNALLSPSLPLTGGTPPPLSQTRKPPPPPPPPSSSSSSSSPTLLLRLPLPSISIVLRGKLPSPHLLSRLRTRINRNRRSPPPHRSSGPLSERRGNRTTGCQRGGQKEIGSGPPSLWRSESSVAAAAVAVNACALNEHRVLLLGPPSAWAASSPSSFAPLTIAPWNFRGHVKIRYRN